MKKILFVVTLLSFGLILSTPQALSQETPEQKAQKQLQAFSPAKAGMQRLVIYLPHKERGEENAFKVELLPGKMMMTDGVNRVRLGTQIESRPLKGWGYTYYDVTGRDLALSTKIGVPTGTQMMKTFVSGQSLMIRYNSRLPIVIYAPQGQLVKYRIWKADDTFTSAPQG